MAKYQKYTEYKDSGVEWLGEIPSHWDFSCLKYLLDKMVAGGTPESTNDAYWAESGDGIPWVSIADITKNFEITATKKDVTELGLSVKNLQILPKNTILYSIFASLGKVSSAQVPLVTNQAILGLIPKVSKLDNRYLVRWLQAIESNLAIFSTSNTQDNLNAEKVGNLPLFNPPLNEQRSIANFLDHETAKIDTLIAKQEKLIELLKEKRQAVISHAVTKGLNPNVQMKDSGVEWLGEVPEHWRICRLKHVGYIQSGIAKGKDLTGKTSISVPMLRVANVQDGYLNLDEVHQIDIEPEQLERYLLQNGDVLMNEGGDNDKLGRGAVWRNEIKNCIHQNHVFAIRTTVIEPEWLDILTRASYAKFHFFRQSKQSTNLASISATNIKETPILVPPNNEREQILGYLNRQFNQFSKLENRCYQQVELLKERRTALISAAVTGKIDVRHWQNPNKNKEADTELSA